VNDNKPERVAKVKKDGEKRSMRRKVQNTSTVTSWDSFSGIHRKESSS